MICRHKRCCMIFLVSVILMISGIPLKILLIVLISANNRNPKNNFYLETFQYDIVEKSAIRETGRQRNNANYEVVDAEQCSPDPPNLIGKISVPTFQDEPPTWEQIIAANPGVVGGRYSPPGCISHHRVAIIIPLRGRDAQLRTLLFHIHPILQRQELDYTIYTITQAGSGVFNRGKLLNVGVAEARKDRHYDCFIFHDVDLLVEDDGCLYWCSEDQPRHVSVYIDKFDYRELYYRQRCSPPEFFGRFDCFGGVSMMSQKQFEDANGFSNLYWGWGGEDDDAFMRLWKRGYTPTNPYGHKCSFRMITHAQESSNNDNSGRHSLLYHAISRMDKEGFNSLRYKVKSIERQQMYSNITVDIGRPSARMTAFMSETFSWFNLCGARMPWNT